MATHPRNRRVEIMPMRLGDLDEVMEIERRSFRGPWSRQVFIEELGRDWARVDVIKERLSASRAGSGWKVLGFSNYWLVSDEVHLLNVAVHPDFRGKGYGAQLLAHLIEFARRHRCRYVTLEVRRSNEGAIKLYHRFGFRSVGIRPNYYVEDSEDAVVMLLDFQDPTTGSETS